MRIKAEKLGKRFNREWIFRNLDYTFEGGNTYAITGPNGSGKSTLLHVLWGQVPQSAGTLSYANAKGPLEIEEVYQHISIAAPYMELIEEFTLREIIAFHYKFKKLRTGLTPEGILEKMELAHARSKTLSNFSSGMKQRVKLALAFYSETPLIFLDEPTTNLDKKSVAWYADHLAALPRETLIVIASNQESEYPATATKLDLLSFK